MLSFFIKEQKQQNSIMMKYILKKFFYLLCSIGVILFMDYLSDELSITKMNNIKILETCQKNQPLKIDGQSTFFCRSEICAIGQLNNQIFYIPEEFPGYKQWSEKEKQYQTCSCHLKEGKCCIPFLQLTYRHAKYIAKSQILMNRELFLIMYLILSVGAKYIIFKIFLEFLFYSLKKHANKNNDK